jgi:hypothetical protein
LPRLLAFFTVIAALLPTVARSAPPPRPPMFAAYYVWYATPHGPHGRWSGWRDRHPSVPLNRDISSAAYPLIGPYDSDDREVVRWHIRLAKAAGISGFFVSWWGPAIGHAVPHLTESSFENVVLPIAEEEHFQVALMDETAQFSRDFDQVKQWAADYLAKYKDSPAYLKIDGKPVYYLYQVSFEPRLTPPTLRELIDFVEGKVGPVFWIVDKISNAGDRLHIPADWLARPPLADAYAFYGTFSNFRAWTYDDLIGRYSGVVRAAHQAGMKMMVPVHPGHDNSRTRNKQSFIIPRENGETLRGYLRAAAHCDADFILLTSWNEWPETTVVEPAATSDDPYDCLKIVAEFNGVEFKQPAEPARARRQPATAATTPAAASPTQTP